MRRGAVNYRSVTLALIAAVGCSGSASATAEAESVARTDTADSPGSTAEASKAQSAIERHDRALVTLAQTRTALAEQYAAAQPSEQGAIRRRAQQALERAIIDDVFPAWLGMPWSMSKNSTATRPHEPGMSVGCSYFVTSVLQSAGVQLENRYTFAQAPALHIQRSLAPKREDLHTYFSIPAKDLHRNLAALGDGLYIIGLDTHVGFVVVRGEDVRFVHASYTGARVVTDEPLLGAVAIDNSRPKGYFVTPLFQDGRLVDMWLRGQVVPFQKLGA